MPKVGTAYVSIRARLDRLEKDLADAKGLTVKRATETANAVSKAFKGIAAYFGVRQIIQFGEAVFETGRQVARLEKAFKEITGSTGAANLEFDFLRKTSDQLGQNFYDLAEAYKGLLAASKGTAMEGKAVQDVFYGVAKATTTLGLSAVDVKFSLYAIQQMMSKGKVSAEELRRQLGERLPGAFNLAAEAMGVTTTELDNMLKAGTILSADFLPKFADLLQKRYSGAVDEATRASNKLTEAWKDFKKTAGEQGFMDFVVESMNDLSATIKDKEFLNAVKDLSDLFVLAAKVGKVTVEIIGGLPLSLTHMGNKILEAAGMPGTEGVADLFKNRERQIERQIITHRKAAETALKDMNGWRGALVGEEKYIEIYGREMDRVRDLTSQLKKLREERYTGAVPADIYGLEPPDPVEAERVAKEYTDAELAAFQKGANDYVSMWELAAKEKYEVLSRMYEDEIEFDKKAEATRVAIAMNRGIEDTYGVDWDRLTSEAEDAASDMEKAFMGWGNEFASMLNDAFWNADFSFSKIAESFGRMLTQMIIQKKIVEPLFEGVFGATVQHAGGPAGSGPTRQVSPWLFAAAPRLHSGLYPDEFPAILQRGETVIPKGKSRGGAGVVVNIINNAGVGVGTQERQTPQGMQLDVILDNATAGNLSKRGSATNRTLRNTYGARENLVAR